MVSEMFANRAFKRWCLGKNMTWVTGEEGCNLYRHAEMIAWVRGISERNAVNTEVFEVTAE